MRKLKSYISTTGTKLLNWLRLTVWFDHSEGMWHIQNDYSKPHRRVFKDHKLVASIRLNRELRAKLAKLGE
jgi:uncharacterized UPF0146 family protein